jgi:predicted dehydrogenase
MARYRFAIVGCGVMGNQHSRNVYEHPDCQLVRLIDVDRGRAEALAARYRDVQASTSFKDALRDDVDAVILAVPHAAHRDYTIAAMRAGKHVMIEKPISLNPEQAQEMIDAARQTGRVLQVGHVLRFYPANLLIKQIAASGQLGRLFQLRYHAEHFPDLSRRVWIASPEEGGVIIGAAIHHTDLMAWWAGPIRAVRAYGLTIRPMYEQSGMHDHCLITYEFASGALGESCYSVSTHSKGLPYNEAMLSFEQGTIVLNSASGDIYLNNQVRVLDYEPGIHKIQSNNDWGIGLQYELRAFLDTIADGPPRITPEEALYGIRVATAARKSAEASEPGVRVAIPGD